MKSNNKKNYTANFENLVDLVDHDGKVKFLVLDDGHLQLKSDVVIDGLEYEPPPKEYLNATIKTLPRAEEVCTYYNVDSDSKLYDDLVVYHENISELPDKNHYHLLTLWDFHTYLIEKFHYSPYIWLYGVAERGKSRTGKGCAYVAYRGVHLETLREAHIIRMAGDLKATIFFDVMDIWKKAIKNSSEDLILHRFEKGGYVPRILYPEKGPFQDTNFYDIFGATVIGTNEEVENYLDSRSIRITMEQTDKKFDEDVTPEVGLPFKERLVAFRARHLKDQLPHAVKPVNSRIGDILKPLIQVVKLVKPEYEESFIAYIQNLNNEKLELKSESKEGKVLSIIAEIIDSSYEEGELISISNITDHYNEEYNPDGPDRFNISSHSVGKITAKLGLPKERNENGSHVVYISDKIYPVFKNYGINILQTSEKLQKLHNLQESNDYSDLEPDNCPNDYEWEAKTTEKLQDDNSPKSLNNSGVPDISDDSDIYPENWEDTLPDYLKNE